MNNQRPRIDLDGVALSSDSDPHMVIAIFRYRTTEGLVLLLPESAEVTVPWTEVEEASLDLGTGAVRVRLRSELVAAQSWARGAHVLVGRWLDRYTMR